ncbi:hypothetical protein ElyMa_000576000 [Elysia marginata]|uniref:Uncharacterized protein n=1 Tax=Elysia marginata TaxID=1093978 RepID=A0AAV4G3H0_9GAST|nr:hypothetical protein ElyMa_000576000 [Elysia marginata]
MLKVVIQTSLGDSSPMNSARQHKFVSHHKMITVLQPFIVRVQLQIMPWSVHHPWRSSMVDECRGRHGQEECPSWSWYAIPVIHYHIQARLQFSVERFHVLAI